jgi:ubiquinone/menaquinone biosynthesis C-methylase UbiE
MGGSQIDSVLHVMRADWDQRAQENAEHFVQNQAEDWDRREFFRSGEINAVNEVLSDMRQICGGNRSSLDLDMLELGCGVGRMTRMLSRVFRSVTAVDISSVMIEQARHNLLGLDNVRLLVGDGATLAGLEDESFDFAFSFIVFQHIPSIEVIQSYCREVNRVLRAGSLLKFQVQGAEWDRESAPDTWHGVSVSETLAQELATGSGFTLAASTGAGSQYFWLWFRKPPVVCAE